MDEIIKQSTPLIEAIVSSYDSLDREDLIQEASFKVQYASQYFNPAVSNLHNYYTTVIKNCCISYIGKAERELLIGDRSEPTDDEEEEIELPDPNPSKQFQSKDEMLDDLIESNRKRFPSMPTNVLDDMSEYIYTSLKDFGETPRTTLKQMIDLFVGVDREIINAVYQSTICYMRRINIGYAKKQLAEPDEFSLLRDLKEVLGEKAYRRVAVVFAGTTLRFP